MVYFTFIAKVINLKIRTIFADASICASFYCAKIMTKKVYYLHTCSTCQRILKTLELNAENIDLQDIKTQVITPEQLDEMARLSGSFESLFSRRAMKYKSMGLKDKTLSEQDYRKLILDEYTFLKRPVFIIGNEIFIGNSAKTVAAISEVL